MKISGFTIVRNVIKLNYPIREAVHSILPLCDEFIINVGDSEDDTLNLMKSMKDPHIKIIQNRWDLSEGKTVLAKQTNIALSQCRGEWAFYLQADEVIHERDLPMLKRYMQKYLTDENVEAFRFKWLHFYGSYYRYRVDSGWFQKQSRIVRNNGQVESYEDAFAFKRKDNRPLKHKNTGCLLYHYGWVHPGEIMTRRRLNAEQIGFTSLNEEEREGLYSYGDLNRFPVYFGTHPSVMNNRIQNHRLSQEDLKTIRRKYWWHPGYILKIRYKTGRRIKEKVA